MIVFGLISSVFDLLTFAILVLLLKATEAEFQTVWFLASLFTELLVVFVLRTRRPLFASRPGGILALSACGASALTLFILVTEPIRKAMGFVTISPSIFFDHRDSRGSVRGHDRARKTRLLRAVIDYKAVPKTGAARLTAVKAFNGQDRQAVIGF